ncbi:MAG: hypothetical protein FD123_2140 [Bacteroidetes bacterium]|nr:MAG: hypothetical protein FD123_2140 [Bacteroidota bacterium]
MKPITYYQASGLTDLEVKSQFVVRKNELERVISEIRRDDMKGSIQHYIFVGQRGSGKSTLLRRIQAEINTDKELNERLIAINLSEEQAGIYRLHDLWDRVCQELRMNHKIEVEEVKWEDYENDLTDFARALYSAMQKGLKKTGKKIVLLLDNIDRILESVKANDNHLFRELLMNYKDVRIIGGSTRLSEHHWKYDQPFYEFFNVIRLAPLTKEELKELLVFWSNFLKEPKLGEFVCNNSGRLNALRILSDGMPRTMLNLVELMIDRPGQQGYDYLRYILDRATPVYQERLGILSPLHQKIVLELSFFWDAAKVKELSEATRIESKTLSAALAQLVELQIVDKIKGKGKNLMYILRERFFNLWLIMTQGGPKQKSQVKWLTVFLETWYNEQELKEMYQKFINEIDGGVIDPDRAVIKAKAFVHLKNISIDERDLLLSRIHEVIGDRKEYLELLPAKAADIIMNVFALIDAEAWSQAIEEMEKIDQDFEMKYHMIGFLFEMKGEIVEAEKLYRKGIKKNIKGTLSLLADIYKKEERYEDAEKFYLKAIQYSDVKGLIGMGELCEIKGDATRAEEYYIHATENGSVIALHALAEFYAKNKRNEEAEKYYLLAIKKGYIFGAGPLAFFYFDNNIKKEKAYELIVAYNSRNQRIFDYQFFFCAEQIIAIWAGLPEKISLIENELGSIVDSKNEFLLKYIISECLVHKQATHVWNWFLNQEFGEKIREMLRLLFFVTARFINNSDAQLKILAIAPELIEPVDEIYQDIIERQEFYYGKNKNT